MTDPVSSSTSSVTDQYAVAAPAANTTGQASTELDLDDFLELMTAQISNQNPLDPVDNSEFFNQIASFSTVSGIDDMNTTMSSLAMQMSSTLPLQAAALVGHDVLVQTDTVSYSGQPIDGAVELSTSGDTTVEIRNSAGEVVRTIPLGAQEAGMTSFTWDGTGSNGEPLPAGDYTMSATVQTGETVTGAVMYIQAPVTSVAIGPDGLALQVEGLGATTFDQVREIL
jgi:flagellar basal-body rod modification protein FlgD